MIKWLLEHCPPDQPPPPNSSGFRIVDPPSLKAMHDAGELRNVFKTHNIVSQDPQVRVEESLSTLVFRMTRSFATTFVCHGKPISNFHLGPLQLTG